MDNPQKKRLVAELPVMMHNELKAVAKKHNVSVTDLVFYLLNAYLEQQRKL